MFKIQQLVSLFLQLVKGIINALKSAESMVELEKEIQILVQQVAARLLEFALYEIDTRLAKERNPEKYKNIGIRSRTMITTLGVIEIKRRYYKDNETGENHFLLDEALGLSPRSRVSPRLERMMLDLGTETTFRKASNTLEYLVPGISHITVWNEIQRAGAKAKQETEERQAELFEDGIIPEGKHSVKGLNIEADGVMIRQQQTSKRHEEVKLVVGYESKEGEERKRLVNRKTVAGVANSNTIWEQASAIFGAEWQLTGDEEIRIGGDGAAWVKEGTEVFPGATYHLDLFHLRTRLMEA
ncbi:MAG: ISLre2 family transposase, partial [Syntrophaceticus sp.]